MRLFGAALVACGIVLSSAADAGQSTITRKDGSKTVIMTTNKHGSMITQYDRTGRVTSTGQSGLQGRAGHLSLIGQYRRGGSVQTHWD